MKNSETILFNFMPALTYTDEDENEPYPYKPVDRARVEQIFLLKTREKSKTGEKVKRNTRK